MRSRSLVPIVFLVLAVFLLIAGCTSTVPPARINDTTGTTPAATLTTLVVPVTTGSCIDGLAFCSGYCRDLRTDTANCGICGSSCPAGQGCVGGTCKHTDTCTGESCLAPTAVLTGKASLGSTTLPGTSTTAPGVPLTTAAVTTAITCPASRTLCSGKCVDLLTDNNNCGSCGYTCPTGTRCEGSGTCSVITTIPTTAIPVKVTGVSLPVDRFGLCPKGYSVCGSDCVFLANDSYNCGACGVACSGASKCVAAFCQYDPGSPPAIGY
jgi:hypothetical protein